MAEDKIDRLEREKKLAEERLALYEAESRTLKEITTAKQKLAEATLQLLEADNGEAKEVDNARKAAERYKNELKDLAKTALETAEAQKKAQDDFATALGNTITAFTGVTTGSETLIGSFFKLRKSVQEGETSTEDFTKTMDSMFDSLNVGASIMSKVIQSTLTMAAAHDSALASFNKTTGAAGHYNNELLALERSNRIHGISTAEMGESYSSLMSGLSGFGVMAESERMRLGELGAQYEKAGISTSDFVGSIEAMTRGLGMSTTAAEDMVEESRLLAQSLGMNVGEVLADLNQALPKLASYGEDVTHIFKDLERQAQRTGFEVGELIDIAAQYRTFDSAATAAGNLNAVLGTQVFSTMGMLEANLEGPEQLIEYMTDNLHNSVGDWDTLNTYQKDAVANAANMTTEQMNQLMNQRNMTQEEKDRQTSRDQAMKSARDMMQELGIIFAQFAVAIQPIFNAFKGIVGFASFMLDWSGKFGGAIGQIGALLTLWIVGSFIKGIAKGLIMNATLAAQIPILSRIAAKYREIAAAKMAGGGTMGPGQVASTGGQNLVTSTRGRMFAGRALGVAGGAMGAYNVAKSENKWKTFGKGLLGAGAGFLVGGPMGAAAGFGMGTSFDNGGGVGGTGPTPATVHGGEAVVPIQKTPAAENLAGMLAERTAGNNAAVVTAVTGLGSKLDSMVAALNSPSDTILKIDDRELGRVMNSHLGEPGYQKIDLRTT